MPILQGPLRGKRWIAGSHVHGCWLGSYEFEKQQMFISAIKPGAVVYDIGANVGFYTLLASQLAGPQGRVYAFEPLPRNLRFLRDHVRINKLTNAEVIDAAVSDREGTATFDDQAAPAMGSISNKGGITVRLVSLDAMVAGGKLVPPAFMKIDVEGAEGDVLAGAAGILRDHHPTIFLATHGGEVHARCLGMLRGAGYSLAPIGPGTIDSCDELLATYPQ